MRIRVLAQAVTSAAVAATISMLAACGPTTADPLGASHKPAAAQPGSQVSSARHHAHRARHHASAPAVPNPGAAASAAPSQPGPNTAAKHAPAKTGSEQGAQPASAPGAGVVRFGLVTSEDSNASINVDPDHLALTALFSDLEAKSDGVASNGTHMAIPLTGGARNATITVYASGYVFTHHATARLVFRLNGLTIVRDFPSGADREFIQPIELPAIGGSAYQLSVAIDEQPSSARGAAYINVSAINAQIT